MRCEPLRGDTFIVLRRDDAMQCDTVTWEPKRYESGHVGYEISTIENRGVVPPIMKLQWLKNKMEEFNSPPLTCIILWMACGVYLFCPWLFWLKFEITASRDTPLQPRPVRSGWRPGLLGMPGTSSSGTSSPQTVTVPGSVLSPKNGVSPPPSPGLPEYGLGYHDHYDVPYLEEIGGSGDYPPSLDCPPSPPHHTPGLSGTTKTGVLDLTGLLRERACHSEEKARGNRRPVCKTRQGFPPFSLSAWPLSKAR